MVAEVQAYVPGYRLKQKVQFDRIERRTTRSASLASGRMHGLKTSIFLEVEGAAHYLPAYAGNLDIMTSGAATAESIAERCSAVEQALFMFNPHQPEKLYISRRHPARWQPRRSATSTALEHVVQIARRWTRPRSTIEVAHGDGLQGSASTTASARIPTRVDRGGRKTVTMPRSPRCCCRASALCTTCTAPSRPARASVRVATHCTEANISAQHIEIRTQLGMDTVRLPDDEPHVRAWQALAHRPS
jgi:hypothetical protein